MSGWGTTSEREAPDREAMKKKKNFQATVSLKRGNCKGKAQKVLMIGPPVTREATNTPEVYASGVTSPNSSVLGWS